MSFNNHEHIGGGGEHVIYASTKSPFVLKLPRIWNVSPIERVQQEIELLEKYAHGFLFPTKVRNFGRRWIVRQERLKPGFLPLSSEVPDVKGLYNQIQQLAEGLNAMYDETGYGFDWFGVGGFSKIPQILTHPTYWYLGNLIVYTKNNERKIGIIDTGLLLTPKAYQINVQVQRRIVAEKAFWEMTLIGMHITSKKTGLNLVPQKALIPQLIH